MGRLNTELYLLLYDLAQVKSNDDFFSHVNFALLNPDE